MAYMAQRFLSFSLLIIFCLGCHSRARKDPQELIWVKMPAGSYDMGITLDEMKRLMDRPNLSRAIRKQLPREVPRHRVEVGEFEILKTEVTVAAYRQCIAAGKCKDTKKENHCTHARPDPEWMPINCVTWTNAKDFCSWAGGRLPTEAEWEFAARSLGKDIRYPWGNEPEPNCNYAVTDEHGRGCGRRTLWPVCSKPKGNTQQGLCDMAGNAWEWVDDEAALYPGIEKISEQELTRPKKELFSKNARIIRGGGISSTKEFRTTMRGAHKADFEYGGLSFRCVRTVKKPQ